VAQPVSTSVRRSCIDFVLCGPPYFQNADRKPETIHQRERLLARWRGRGKGRSSEWLTQVVNIG